MRIEKGDLTYKDLGYNSRMSRRIRESLPPVLRGDVAQGDLTGTYPRPSVNWESGYLFSDTRYAKSGITPTTASDDGDAGQIAYDSGYIYVCISADTWKRAQLLTW